MKIRSAVVPIGFITCLLGSMVYGGLAEITQLNKPSEIDRSGNILYAVNFGYTGDIQYTGITFTSAASYPGLSYTRSDEGFITKWGYTSPNTGYPKLDMLLGGMAVKWWTAASPDCSIYVNAPGLTIGHLYQLQMIFYDGAHSNRIFDFFVEGTTIAQNIESISQQGGVVGKGGFRVTYSFTATDPVLNFGLTPVPNDGNTGSGFSGFVVSEIPEPATFGFILIGTLIVGKYPKRRIIKH